MTRFLNGPAAHVLLSLRRSPMFLRVVESPEGAVKGFDALDELGDVPQANERLYAYRLISSDGFVFVDGVDKQGRRCGHASALATYEVVPEQPSDATMRYTDTWQAWCLANKPKKEGDQ